MARGLLAAKPDIATVLCPIQEVGHIGLEARCNGVESIMAEQGIPVVRFTITYNLSESAGLIGDAFAANPDANAIVTLGPGPAESFYAYASENNVTPDQVIHATFDTSPAIFAAIADGQACCALTSSPTSRALRLSSGSSWAANTCSSRPTTSSPVRTLWTPAMWAA